MKVPLFLLMAAGLTYSGIYDNGVGISSSLGSLSGGLGVAVEYQYVLLPKSRITPTIGGGISGFWIPAYSAGILYEYGYASRFLTAITFGSGGVEYHNSNSNENGPMKDTNLLIGISLLGGYKRVSPDGSMFNIGGGLLLPFNAKYIKWPCFPAITIGYGIKFGKNNSDRSVEKVKYRLPRAYGFLRKPDSVGFIVTDPKYLVSPTTSAIDTANQMYNAIKGEIYRRISNYSLQFKELPEQYTRQTTIAFNNLAFKNKGRLDSLPYTVWEPCIDDHIPFLSVFYIYKTKEYANIERNEIKDIVIPVPKAVVGIGLHRIPVYINLENVQMGFAFYSVKENKLLFARTSSDEYYESPIQLIESLFQEMGWR